MVRKTALIGCKSSPMIRTFGMRRLQLRANVRSDTMLQVHLHRDGAVTTKVFVGPGVHLLDDAEWAQVVVADGYHQDALCLLEGAA